MKKALLALILGVVFASTNVAFAADPMGMGYTPKAKKHHHKKADAAALATTPAVVK